MKDTKLEFMRYALKSWKKPIFEGTFLKISYLRALHNIFLLICKLVVCALLSDNYFVLLDEI